MDTVKHIVCLLYRRLIEWVNKIGMLQKCIALQYCENEINYTFVVEENESYGCLAKYISYLISDIFHLLLKEVKFGSFISKKVEFDKPQQISSLVVAMWHFSA